MIGNNSCGVHSVVAGRTADNVEALEILTYRGGRLRAAATSEDDLDAIVTLRTPRELRLVTVQAVVGSTSAR